MPLAIIVVIARLKLTGKKSCKRKENRSGTFYMWCQGVNGGIGTTFTYFRGAEDLTSLTSVGL